MKFWVYITYVLDYRLFIKNVGNILIYKAESVCVSPNFMGFDPRNGWNTINTLIAQRELVEFLPGPKSELGV